jgi:hypothetical protein
MTARNEIGMVIFLFAGIAFVCIGLFSRAIKAGAREPYVLKWCHRLSAIVIGVNALVIALEMYRH